MNKKHLIEFCDKLFEMQKEYGLYIRSTDIYDFDNHHIADILYDNWDGDDKAFYRVSYLDENIDKVVHIEYVK